MKRIDRETVQRILDAADIVEVVSDFVTLKRRGANYIGLCPFHNERTPSFSVSKAKGICKCFSCGKGGSPVNFIMEIEQMSFQEALRYLAKKYNIEIQERELTDAERRAENDREAMLAVNEWAMHHFQHNIKETKAGRDIGLAYFRERGINDAMIERFHLGYALEERDELLKAAIAQGYSEKYLIDTGLCSRNEQGRVYDRFRGRVIYPVFSISGKVLAFGGRTLRNDKSMAKYVNSPESSIYSKRTELYGLYQAKQAINKNDKCILVEGYMDVISMHQAGIENVVASSGTSLTKEQVHLIHRFTSNVTVIYDSDAAGIKASLRGIDLLLAQGLSVKVLLLPDGDDPDSFAQNNPASAVTEYISANETDFIAFKTRILLGDAKNDPILRARAINDIVRSIAIIPDEITRQVYIQETARSMEIDDGVLTLQVSKFRNEDLRRASEEELREKGHRQLESDPEINSGVTKSPANDRKDTASFLRKFELAVAKYAVKYGCMHAIRVENDDNTAGLMSIIDFIRYELTSDDVAFENPDIAATFAEACKLAEGPWQQDFDNYVIQTDTEISTIRQSQIAQARNAITGGIDELERYEKEMEARLALERQKRLDEFTANYISRALLNHPDDTVRNLATELVSDKYILSKVHTKYTHVETEAERLHDLVPRAIYELKDAILDCRLKTVRNEIANLSAESDDNDNPKLRELMTTYVDLTKLKSEFAKYLGERVITGR